MGENSLIKQKNHAEIEGIKGPDALGEGKIWALFALSAQGAGEVSLANELRERIHARGPELVDSGSHAYFLRSQYAEKFVSDHEARLSGAEKAQILAFGAANKIFISLWISS